MIPLAGGPVGRLERRRGRPAPMRRRGRARRACALRAGGWRPGVSTGGCPRAQGTLRSAGLPAPQRPRGRWTRLRGVARQEILSGRARRRVSEKGLQPPEVGLGQRGPDRPELQHRKLRPPRQQDDVRSRWACVEDVPYPRDQVGKRDGAVEALQLAEKSARGLARLGSVVRRSHSGQGDEYRPSAIRVRALAEEAEDPVVSIDEARAGATDELGDQAGRGRGEEGDQFLPAVHRDSDVLGCHGIEPASVFKGELGGHPAQCFPGAPLLAEEEVRDVARRALAGRSRRPSCRAGWPKPGGSPARTRQSQFGDPGLARAPSALLSPWRLGLGGPKGPVETLLCLGLPGGFRRSTLEEFPRSLPVPLPKRALLRPLTLLRDWGRDGQSAGRLASLSCISPSSDTNSMRNSSGQRSTTLPQSSPNAETRMAKPARYGRHPGLLIGVGQLADDDVGEFRRPAGHHGREAQALAAPVLA